MKFLYGQASTCIKYTHNEVHSVPDIQLRSTYLLRQLDFIELKLFIQR